MVVISGSMIVFSRRRGLVREKEIVEGEPGVGEAGGAVTGVVEVAYHVHESKRDARGTIFIFCFCRPLLAWHSCF